MNGRVAKLSIPAAVMLEAVAAMTAVAMIPAGSARADDVAYLLNVTLRPGYRFANADAALSYGHGICDKLNQGRAYPQLMYDVKADFNTEDEYQASYLIAQAVNELCPEAIWQLHESAAHYRPTAP